MKTAQKRPLCPALRASPLRRCSTTARLHEGSSRPQCDPLVSRCVFSPSRCAVNCAEVVMGVRVPCSIANICGTCAPNACPTTQGYVTLPPPLPSPLLSHPLTHPPTHPQPQPPPPHAHHHSATPRPPTSTPPTHPPPQRKLWLVRPHNHAVCKRHLRTHPSGPLCESDGLSARRQHR
jgi:hypothetical protein